MERDSMIEFLDPALQWVTAQPRGGLQFLAGLGSDDPGTSNVSFNSFVRHLILTFGILNLGVFGYRVLWPLGKRIYRRYRRTHDAAQQDWDR